MSFVETLFNTDEVMVFENVATGKRIETTNMFYFAFKDLWKFIAFKQEGEK